MLRCLLKFFVHHAAVSTRKKIRNRIKKRKKYKQLNTTQRSRDRLFCMYNNYQYYLGFTNLLHHLSGPGATCTSFDNVQTIFFTAELGM